MQANFRYTIIAVLAFASGLCAQTPTPKDKPKLPLSDPKNTGKWVFADQLSDEFDRKKLDMKKWTTVCDYWAGRAPSCFSPKNVSVRDGKLVLTTKWEPDYAHFPKEKDDDSGLSYEKYTSAIVMSRKMVKYGYFEIRSKAAKACITSSFWFDSDGDSEIDVFEMIGSPEQTPKYERYFPMCLHNHKKKKEKGKDYTLGYRVADDFHVYGLEWSPDVLKFHADGQLVWTVKKKNLRWWIFDEDMRIIFDMETFPWEGLPKKSSLPASFEIDYIRVWKKQTKKDGDS